MAHVTFIHGIANKPPAEDLLAIWRRTLAQAADPVPLGDLGITSSLVYWADLLNEKPDEDLAAHEGILESTVAAIDASGEVEMPVPQTSEEAAFLQAMRRHLTTLDDEEIDSLVEDEKTVGAADPDAGLAAAGVLERVPLPWCLKKPLMSVLLRDVHHYLFDKTFAPRGKSPVRIRQTIRQRVIDALNQPGITPPHVVVAHSLGSVIAYDCLKRMQGCAPVDGLITLGSPLGLDEIQDRLKPEWSRAEGFPKDTIRVRWVNLFDRLDPVCGFDPILANDFRLGGAPCIADRAVSNPGAWRHSATKYLRQPAFGQALRELLRA